MARIIHTMGRLLAIALLACPAIAQSPDPLVETLSPAQLPARWEALLSALRAVETVEADFHERQISGVRAQPITFRGVLRFDRHRGLSLQYMHPDTYTVIVDDQGVLARDEHGRERPAPANAAESATAVLMALEMDLPRLADRFLIRGRLDPPAWSLAFESLGNSASFIELVGTDYQVRHISLITSEDRRIDFGLGNIVSNAAFSPSERRKHFR